MRSVFARFSLKMNNQRDKNMMNFNQSMPQSRQPMHFHNFMSIPTSTFHANPRIEEGRNSSFKNQLEQNMQQFWKDRLAEAYDTPSDVRGSHMLPLARIKKVMKADEQVKMISAETPVVFAKACEFFIMELSKRAWMHTQENKRRTLQRSDVANAIRDDDLLSFLKDVVPLETYHQDQDNDVDNHPGMYAPAPVPTHPVYPMMNNNLQNMNQAEVAPEGYPAAANNYRFGYTMNFGYNMNDDNMQ
ncbi:hypothetical protein CASFOL_023346 [Castilleja foliolosa]|uniref:Core Histone H2A/H2B/H3 domain-containing protein n=1 Tax=Castilleja foliolosa TaxID=1961234 RepID=A0ABD3CP63_9LAMI